MIKINNDFDIDSTITCGQIFRYELIDDTYVIILKDRVISIKKDGKYLLIESNNEDKLLDVVTDYFDLKRDYKKITSDLINMDKRLEDAVNYSSGLHMIHQDPFETVIEYVISQNNRVPSIANSLNMIALKYGKEVIFNNKKYYLFPEYSKLKDVSVEEYRLCKVGFRDKYIYDIVQAINLNLLDLNKIYEMNDTDALNYLIGFKGIGNKVASCILLFAYHKFNVYPIDTWVKKYMKDEYGIETEKDIKKFTNEKYMEYSGLAIQYMFNYKRNKK